ncbi:trypsin-like serine protease [Streptomyces sp. NPDC002039]|uniref:trypsin-like serine protease n=1 Tax=Streptomyces sp. NPDC002039 TaxID=3154660 RepID=UPI00331DA283
MRSLHSRGGPVRRPRGEPGRAAPRRGSLKVCGASAPGTDDSIARGDSGGPLVAGGKAIGIVSTGNNYCDDQDPVSVLTRVGAVAAGLGLPVGQRVTTRRGRGSRDRAS